MVKLTPHLADAHVGSRIRARRRSRSLSQVAMGQAVGVTFQQIQKYESGANRVSASLLFKLSRVLQTPITWFFEGLDLDDTPSPHTEELASLDAFLLTPEGQELARFFPALSARERRGVVAMVRQIAADEVAGE